ASIARSSVLVLAVGFLALSRPAQAAAPASTAKASEEVNFERHIMGLLGRLGCNAGSCHGSFQGKGGFRLSLFGYDPDLDYASLTRDNQGRRVNPTDPDSSLLLLKATGQVEHGGTRRFGKGDPPYRILRSWIAAGMPRNQGSGAITGVRVSPAEAAFKKADEKMRLKVEATFADNSTEDITNFSDFRTNDENVATVANQGEVHARQPGDTAIVVSYRGQIIPVRVLVPMTPPPGFRYPE